MDRAPEKKIIQSWVNKFEAFGTIENLNWKSERRVSYSGRRKTRADQIIDRVRESV